MSLSDMAGPAKNHESIGQEFQEILQHFHLQWKQLYHPFDGDHHDLQEWSRTPTFSLPRLSFQKLLAGQFRHQTKDELDLEFVTSLKVTESELNQDLFERTGLPLVYSRTLTSLDRLILGPRRTFWKQLSRPKPRRAPRKISRRPQNDQLATRLIGIPPPPVGGPLRIMTSRLVEGNDGLETGVHQPILLSGHQAALYPSYIPIHPGFKASSSELGIWRDRMGVNHDHSLPQNPQNPFINPQLLDTHRSSLKRPFQVTQSSKPDLITTPLPSQGTKPSSSLQKSLKIHDQNELINDNEKHDKSVRSIKLFGVQITPDSDSQEKQTII